MTIGVKNTDKQFTNQMEIVAILSEIEAGLHEVGVDFRQGDLDFQQAKCLNGQNWVGLACIYHYLSISGRVVSISSRSVSILVRSENRKIGASSGS